MKKFTLVPAFLAACLLVAVAFAAKEDRVIASFESLSSSGVSGQATLSSAPQGGTQIHVMVRGLQPNTDYVTQYFTDGACTATPGAQVAAFKANPAGIGQFNVRIDASLVNIKSLSVQQASDLSLKACASVNQ
jgi:hypothetical protein